MKTTIVSITAVLLVLVLACLQKVESNCTLGDIVDGVQHYQCSAE